MKFVYDDEPLFFKVPRAEGAGEHCHEGALFLFHRCASDWPGTVAAG